MSQTAVKKVFCQLYTDKFKENLIRFSKLNVCIINFIIKTKMARQTKIVLFKYKNKILWQIVLKLQQLSFKKLIYELIFFCPKFIYSEKKKRYFKNVSVASFGFDLMSRKLFSKYWKIYVIANIQEKTVKLCVLSFSYLIAVLKLWF